MKAGKLRIMPENSKITYKEKENLKTTHKTERRSKTITTHVKA